MMEFLVNLCDSSVVVSVIITIISVIIASRVMYRYYKMMFDQVMRHVMKHDDMIERFVWFEDDYKEHMRKYH